MATFTLQHDIESSIFVISIDSPDRDEPDVISFSHTERWFLLTAIKDLVELDDCQPKNELAKQAVMFCERPTFTGIDSHSIASHAENR